MPGFNGLARVFLSPVAAVRRRVTSFRIVMFSLFQQMEGKVGLKYELVFLFTQLSKSI